MIRNRIRYGIALLALALVFAGNAAAAGPESPGDYTFAVCGDLHGDYSALAEIAARNPAFLILLGDLTASGTEAQLAQAQAQIAKLPIPVHVTPGNHDIKTDPTLFQKYFPREAGFEFGGDHFIALDTADNNLDRPRLESLPSQPPDQGRLFVYTHTPPFDLRPQGNDHALLDRLLAAELCQGLSGAGTTMLFAGHIHGFYRYQAFGLEIMISGAGGGKLEPIPDPEHVFSHYVLVHVGGEGITPEVVRLPVKPTPAGMAALRIAGRRGEYRPTADDLQLLPALEGTVAFQNQYGNWRGPDFYRGPSLLSLVEIAGGMKPGERLVIRASDGYEQFLGYEAIYQPSELAGPFVLALNWLDTHGMRLACLPPDGLFSNEDCRLAALSAKFVSAGAYWVHNVTELIVEEAP